jgi:FkbM family methyltransferase
MSPRKDKTGQPDDVVRDSRMFKLLRQLLRGRKGLRSKHGANLALDILAANGIEEIAVRRGDGRLIHLSTADKVIASGVIRHGAFSPGVMEAFDRLLTAEGIDRAGLTFVNVGANIGTACLNAYDAGFRRFVAIEPEPGNFRLLRQNLDGLPGADVRCIEAAVGEKPARLALNRHPTNLGAHSFVAASPGASSGDKIEVRVEPLGVLADLSRPFVLFVDVEGFEPQVLRGAAASLEHCVAIVLEITPAKYRPADASDLARIVAEFAGDLTLLPSGERRRTSDLPAVMRSLERSHFDIALLRRAPRA